MAYPSHGKFFKDVILLNLSLWPQTLLIKIFYQNVNSMIRIDFPIK